MQGLTPTQITYPDNATVNYLYHASGRLSRVSGAREYPAGYAYDDHGRMTKMTNWSQYASLGGERERRTQWDYDTYRGWLSAKVYADNSRVQYQYSASGLLTNQIWARGTNLAYAYNAAGQLTNIAQVANSTALALAGLSYDGRGRLSQAVQGTNTSTLVWNGYNQLAGHAYTAGGLNGWSVTNHFDDYGRREQLQVLSNGVAVVTVGYDCDAASRLETVSSGDYSATYSYLAYSPLVSQISFKQGTTEKMITAKTYDRLNRLLSIRNSGPGFQPVAFNYQYNAANQRTRVSLGEGGHWAYDYDPLGQVKLGKKYFTDGMAVPGQQFEYTHDDIGNRSGTGILPATYNANTVNQYTNRTVPGYVDVLGNASVGAAVTVNTNNTAWRKGVYFHHPLAVNNTNSGVFQGLSVQASRNGTNSTISSGYVMVPKYQETFQHDADGNLTQDSLWYHFWDSQNQLKWVECKLTPPATNLACWLEFNYDWQGRRIRKQVYNSNDDCILDRRLIYDGWNLIAELNATNNAVIMSYVWGNDLSGTPQGAGGVGGLLMIKVHVGAEAGCYFPCYNSNGNIAALINAADGSIAAVYEYGPFGELIRATGPMAHINPFRFSTKYCDDETGLIYYGFRYYSPSLGRWLSKDPIGEKGGVNLYAFCESDPMDYYDTDGREVFFIQQQYVPRIAPYVPPRINPGLSPRFNPELLPRLNPPVPPGTTMPRLNPPVPVLPPQIPPTPNPTPTTTPSPNPEPSSQSGGPLPPEQGGPPWPHGSDGDCTPDRKRFLQHQKDAICNQPRSCQKCRQDINEIWRRIRINENCIKARENVMNECYRGGNKAHKDEVENVRKVLDECYSACDALGGI